MTSRLYVKRGGAASAETEVMLAAADRKGSPVFDGTTPKVNLGMRYADGESSNGTYVLTDPLAEIPSDTYRIPPHGLVTLTEDASGDELWLARVRNSQISAGRRAVSVPKNEVEWEVTTVDCNIDLTGNHFVHPWERPAETDIDRIIALQAHILNGDSSTAAHHRKSTVITAATVGDGHLLQDGTTHLDDSLTNLEAKTYPPGTVARDVLEDISEVAGKTYGVVIHHTGGTSHLCLLYVQELDHETYDSAIKISQNIADLAPDDPDTPVFAPIWDRGPGKQIENDHVISGLIDIYGGTADNPLTVFVDQSADDETPHEYWTDAYFDSDSKTEAQATFRANQILASRRPPGHTTHQLSIKMHPEQTRLLCAGMSVSVKSAVVTGAPLSYVKRRVSELRWELAPDGDWFAHLDLDRPIRVRRGSLQAPQAPDTGTPGTPPTAPTEDYRWSFDDLGGSGAANLYDDNTSTIYWFSPNWEDGIGTSAWHDDYDAHMSFGDNGAKTQNVNPVAPSGFPVTAGEIYTFSADMSQRQADSNVYMRVHWYTAGGTLLSVDYIAGPGVSVAAKQTYTKVVTAPATATHAVIFVDAATGEFGAADNIVISHGGSSGTAGTPSTSAPTTVGGTGEGQYSDSGEYVPVGSVLEHQYITEGGPYHEAADITIADAGGYYVGTDVEAALQELGAGLNLQVNVVDPSGSSLDLDVSPVSVHEVHLDANCDITFSGMVSNAANRWWVHVFGDGTHVATFPDVLWPEDTAPTFDPTADSHWLEFICTDGVTVYGDYGGAAPTSITEIADLPTAETDTSLVLHPDGTGGIAWGTDATSGGGGASNLASGKVTRSAGDFSLTGSTAFTDVTGASITFTTGTHKVMLTFTGSWYVNNTAGTAALDFTVDGTRVGGTTAGLTTYNQHSTANEAVPCTMVFLTDALSAGSHTFKVQAKVFNSAHTLVVQGADPVYSFAAVEMYA